MSHTKPMSDHRYLHHPKGFVCPFCESEEVELSGADITFLGDSIEQKAACFSCNKTWRNTYTLTGYEVD